MLVEKHFKISYASFPGSLLDLIGLSLEEVERRAPPEKRIGSLLEWYATFRDVAVGYTFPVALRAQLRDGRILAVGIWSGEYRFFPERDGRGRWLFEGEEKPDRNRRKMFWISREGENFHKEYDVFPQAPTVLAKD